MKLLFMTSGQLQTRKWISEQDKKLIEETVGISGEQGKKTEALRGYLVRIWRELVPDDNLRADIGAYAAAWCDGWSASQTHMVRWVRKFELTDYSDLKNNEYECYIVRKSKVDKLENTLQ